MSTDKVREAIAAGRPAFGCWVSIGDPLSAEVIGRCGYDSVILDAQHGGVNWSNLLSMIQAMDLGGTRALVRVSAIEPAQIMRAMDLGALGVVVPMVSTETQAKSAAEAIRYPPRGIRSFGAVRNYYNADLQSVEPLCLVMIETAEAMENLDAIAAVPGVDGLFVGPIDLALALGLPVSMEMPAPVLAAIDKIVLACRKYKKICGSASLGVPNAGVLIEHGVQYIAHGSDLGYLRRGISAELKQLRALPTAKQ